MAQTETGCDSTVITSVDVKPLVVDTIDVALCPGDSLLIGNTFVKNPGFYSEMLTAADGCDSVSVSAVQFRTIPSDTVDVQLCPGDSLLIGTTLVKTPGFYPERLLSTDGCDSILINAVQFRTIPVDTIDVPLCPGDSLLIGNTFVKTPGFYSETLATIDGCDSILVSAVEFRTITYDTVDVQLCAGDSLLIGNAFVKTPGFYSEMLATSNDCDQILVSAVTFRPILTDTIEVELCPGDSLLIGNTVVKTSGFYPETLISSDGCDSILVSDVQLLNTPTDTISVELCTGDSLLINNIFIKTPGFYRENLTAANGCDSTLVTFLQFNTIPTDTIQVEICPGDSLLINNTFVKTPGFYPETFTAGNGCDSILVTSVQFKAIQTDTIQVEI
ncbi:MAG: hypothetical protein KDA77_22585, partial [Planctomycetaceae bacterium]|nr:hypothetical protein [Planctomycetaceae bacterium]